MFFMLFMSLCLASRKDFVVEYNVKYDNEESIWVVLKVKP